MSFSAELTKKSEMEHAEELRALEKKCASLSEQNTLLSSNLSAIVKSKAKVFSRIMNNFSNEISLVCSLFRASTFRKEFEPMWIPLRSR